jgi:hypothetical protein
MTVLDLEYNFASLSTRDLLDARDAYHYHLLSKPNVVGTAIGLYLIRRSDPWPSAAEEARPKARKRSEPRTLWNSEVRPYSWPCILAFVKRWAPEVAFGPSGQYDPAQILPKTLFLSDGRAVPVCVVEAPPAQGGGPEDMTTLGPRPNELLGPGCPIQVETQGELRVATAGALVSDGHAVYALTARHASGDAGQAVFSAMREGTVPVGRSSALQLTRAPFSDVYPDFPGRRSFVALDVGLVRLDRIADWTSSTYGLPPVGPLADLHERNLSLKLVDQPVVGFGAASGLIRGAVKALFYRHRSAGGFDYVADFMIAPTEDDHVRPGDSGMVWHLDVTPGARGDEATPLVERDLRPLALEWGGQRFDGAGARSTFAVATSLSAVCRLLNVELVTDMTRGVSGYWGRTGHYSIAALAIDAIRDPGLKRLMKANAAILSFELSDIAKKGFDKSVGRLSGADAFVPLADVPDEIWKKRPKDLGGRTGGRDTSGGASRSNGPEHPTHYADIDVDYPPHGKSLRELCLEDPARFLTVDAWLRYYEDMAAAAEKAGHKKDAKELRDDLKQGLLPFRVWQFFDAMVAFLRAGDIVGFVTAAGVAAHYVGDASQPLHGSVLADGDPSRLTDRVESDGKPVHHGKGVHSAFETAMISRYAAQLLPAAAGKLRAMPTDGTLPASGQDIAVLVVALMQAAWETLKPETIVDAFEAAGGAKTVATYDTLYGDFADEAATLLALGAHRLARLWDAAWAAGGGLGRGGRASGIDPSDARDRYIDADFVPSLTLARIANVLRD